MKVKTRITSPYPYTIIGEEKQQIVMDSIMMVLYIVGVMCVEVL